MTLPKRATDTSKVAESEQNKKQKTEVAVTITPLVKQTVFDLKAEPTAAAAADASTVPVFVSLTKEGQYSVGPVTNSAIEARLEVRWSNGQKEHIVGQLLEWHGRGYDRKQSSLDLVFIKSHGPGGDLCAFLMLDKFPEAVVIRVTGPWNELPMSADHINRCTGKRVACIGFMPDHASLTKLAVVSRSIWYVSDHRQGTKSYANWMATGKPAASAGASADIYADLVMGECAAATVVYTSTTPPGTALPWWLIVMDKHEVAPSRKSEDDQRLWYALTEHEGATAIGGVIHGGVARAMTRGRELELAHFKRAAQLLFRSEKAEWLVIDGVAEGTIRYVPLERPDDWRYITMIPFTAHELMSPHELARPGKYAMVQYDEKKNETHFSLRNAVDRDDDLYALSQKWRKGGGGSPGAVRIVLPGKLTRLPDPGALAEAEKAKMGAKPAPGLLPEHVGFTADQLRNLKEKKVCPASGGVIVCAVYSLDFIKSLDYSMSAATTAAAIASNKP